MSPDSRAVLAALLLASLWPAAAPAQDPQLLEPSLRAPLDPLIDESGSFELRLEIDPLAGEALVGGEFTISLGVNPPDELFADSFESP